MSEYSSDLNDGLSLTGKLTSEDLLQLYADSQESDKEIFRKDFHGYYYSIEFLPRTRRRLSDYSTGLSSISIDEQDKVGVIHWLSPVTARIPLPLIP